MHTLMLYNLFSIVLLCRVAIAIHCISNSLHRAAVYFTVQLFCWDTEVDPLEVVKDDGWKCLNVIKSFIAMAGV